MNTKNTKILDSERFNKTLANTLIDLTEYQYRESKISKYLDYDDYWHLLQRGFNFDKFINRMELYETDKIEILANVEIGEMANKINNSHHLTKADIKSLSLLRYNRINKNIKRDEKTLEFLINRLNGYISKHIYEIRYLAILGSQRLWWTYEVVHIPEIVDYYPDDIKKDYNYTDYYDVKFCLNEFKKELEEITKKEKALYTSADYKLKTMDTKHWSNFYNRILNY